MLHTVNKSPFTSPSLETCLGLAVSGSDVLLIEDGVYGAINDTVASTSVMKAMDLCEIYVLGPDMDARGIEPGKLISGIKRIGYDGFVELVVANNKVQSWF